MKKILAGIIALTTVFCTFTGCGSIDDEKADTNETSVETTAESEEKTEEISETETEEDGEINEKTYEDVLNEYIELVNSGETRKALEMQLPDRNIDAFKFMILVYAVNYDDKIDLDAVIDDYCKSKSEDNIKLNKIIKIEDLIEEQENELKSKCVLNGKISEWCKEYGGIDNIDMEKLSEDNEDFDPDDELNSIKLDAKYLEVELEKNGYEPEKVGFVVYRFNGGKWSIEDVSEPVFGFRTCQKEEYSIAEKILKAGNTALVEFDEERILPEMKNVLICSDESKNINVPSDFNVDRFKEKLERYFENVGDYDWFVVVDDIRVVYAAAVKKGTSNVESYSENEIYNSSMGNENAEDISDKSFDEVYDMCAEALK